MLVRADAHDANELCRRKPAEAVARIAEARQRATPRARANATSSPTSEAKVERRLPESGTPKGEEHAETAYGAADAVPLELLDRRQCDLDNRLTKDAFGPSAAAWPGRCQSSGCAGSTIPACFSELGKARACVRHRTRPTSLGGRSDWGAEIDAAGVTVAVVDSRRSDEFLECAVVRSRRRPRCGRTGCASQASGHCAPVLGTRPQAMAAAEVARDAVAALAVIATPAERVAAARRKRESAEAGPGVEGEL